MKYHAKNPSPPLDLSLLSVSWLPWGWPLTNWVFPFALLADPLSDAVVFEAPVFDESKIYKTWTIPLAESLSFDSALGSPVSSII